MAVRYELSVGLNKGHKTSKIKNVKYTGDKKVKGLRASRMKGVSEIHPIIVSVWRNCDFREASTCLCGSAIVITMFTAHHVNRNLVWITIKCFTNIPVSPIKVFKIQWWEFKPFTDKRMKAPCTSLLIFFHVGDVWGCPVVFHGYKWHWLQLL